MPGYPLTTWLRPLLTLVALAGVLSLAACGGGNGAPSQVINGGGGAPLSITPATATAYSGTPFTFLITGGTRPYAILTSDQSALPVVGTLDGDTLVVVPGAVGTDTPVTLTVRDSAGQTTSAAVTVRPALLLPASITITGNPNCSASGSDLCSGQDGTATVQVTGPAGAPLAGRPVRFDVVQGAYSISSTVPGQPLVQSLTVTTDQNGNATVRLVVPVNAATQIATIRATDVTDGSSIVGQFTIAQFVNGSSVLTVIPSGVTTFTGPDTTQCSTGASATFYIFGGTPPYTVATNFPSAISISGAPVQRSGGGFTITTTGQCVTGLTFAIIDAAGQTVLTPPTVSNVLGTAAPPPPTLAVTPSSATISCASPNNLQFLVTGGTGTYNAALTPSPVGSSVTAGATTTVTIPASAAGTVYTLNISSGSQVKAVKITCQ